MFEHCQLISTEAAARPYYAGIDIGGTNIKIGVVDDRGRTLGRTSTPTSVQLGPDAAIARIQGILSGLLDARQIPIDDVLGVGLGAPGTMDIARGMLLDLINLQGWDNYPIRDRMGEACGKPVVFTNDANAAAYGEYWIGSGKDYHSMVMLTLGTGVGGGIIIGDMAIEGETSHGAECGHIIIDYNEDARSFDWGGKGHLEAYVSATSVVLRAREALDAGRASSLSNRIAKGEPLTALMIAEEAEAGDELSREIVLDTAMYLGIGITCLMHVIDPGTVILGGAMDFGGRDSLLGSEFLERVRDEVRHRAFPMPAAHTVIDFAQLGGDAGYVGAAGLARAQLGSMAS